MGMRANWILFVEATKARGDSHEDLAHYWDTIHNVLSFIMIIMSAITTVLATLKESKHQFLPHHTTVILSGVTTVFSALSGFLQPANRKQSQIEAAKGMIT